MEKYELQQSCDILVKIFRLILPVPKAVGPDFQAVGLDR
jgi:hypothetical protein